jgi:hypothetical protein
LGQVRKGFPGNPLTDEYCANANETYFLQESHGAMRSNTARAAELIAAAINCVSGHTSSEIELVFREFRIHPGGGSYRHNTGTTLVWGDINRLIAFLPEIRDVSLDELADQYLVPNASQRQFVIHVDSYKSTAEGSATLPKNIQVLLGRSLGKADLLLVDSTSILKLSVKEPTAKEIKLGQQSASEVYGFTPAEVTLSGGKNFSGVHDAISTLTSRLKGQLVRPDTLTLKQWEKLANTPEQQRLAIVKSRWPNEWSEIVAATLQDATTALDRFLSAAFPSSHECHARNLSEILRHRLLGRSSGPGEVWITSKSGPFRLDEAIKKLSERRGLTAEWTRRPSTKAKDSWLIYVTLSKKRYLVCKIEPSFDGARAKVSQTKGVIYYFQEGAGARTSAEGSVWDLLSDVSG